MIIKTKTRLFICSVLASSVLCLHAGEDKQPAGQPGPDKPAKALLPGHDNAVSQAHADFMKKVAENSARMLEIKTAMDDRRETLYKENEEIKRLWAEMVEMQKEINSILEADKEYSELVLKRDILSSILPKTATQPFRGPMRPMFR